MNTNCVDCGSPIRIPEDIYLGCLNNQYTEGLEKYMYTPDQTRYSDLNFQCSGCIDHAGYADYQSGAGDY